MAKKKSVYVPIILIVSVYSWWAHLYFGNYDINIALKGWSALDFSNSVIFRQHFTNDYPGGASSTGQSLLSWVYPILQRIGITPEFTFLGMTGLEIIVFLSGSFLLFSTLFKSSSPAAYVVLTGVFLLSWARYPNLARFGAPYFHGQFYGFAEGLSLAAIAFFIKGHFRYSVSALALGFVVHPLKSLFCLIFLVGAAISKGTSVLRREIITPFILFFFFAVLWVRFWLGIGSSDASMNAAEFFRFSPLLNSHWYPQNLHILGHRHMLYLTPFISAILIGLSVLVRQNGKDFPRSAIAIGILCLLLTSAFGILVAWFEISPFLVKSCFQRSSLLVLSVIIILVVGQIFRDLKTGNLFFALIAVSTLATAFVSYYTWPVIASLVYAALTLVESKEQEFFWKSLLLCLLCSALLYLLTMWYLRLLQPIQIIFPYKYYNLLIYFLGFACVLVVVLAACSFFPNKKTSINYSVLIVLICVGGIHWSIKWRTLSETTITRGTDYKAVQVWARKNTDKEALFMVDPCTSYGWRDYSIRSSFGTIHEWYKTGWLYSGNKEFFIDGITRGQSLGLDIEDLLGERDNWGPSQIFSILCQTARKAYYSEDASLLTGLITTYGIDYFVFDKNQSSQYGYGPHWQVAFENNSYKVLKP